MKKGLIFLLIMMLGSAVVTFAGEPDSFGVKTLAENAQAAGGF
jgi:hypothetical protein